MLGSSLSHSTETWPPSDLWSSTERLLIISIILYLFFLTPTISTFYTGIVFTCSCLCFSVLKPTCVFPKHTAPSGIKKLKSDYYNSPISKTLPGNKAKIFFKSPTGSYRPSSHYRNRTNVTKHTVLTVWHHDSNAQHCQSHTVSTITSYQ